MPCLFSLIELKRSKVVAKTLDFWEKNLAMKINSVNISLKWNHLPTIVNLNVHSTFYRTLWHLIVAPWNIAVDSVAMNL
jgi:hypothetical protein